MILTDKEMKEIHSSTFGKGLQTFARGIESAVLEKLRQQEPVEFWLCKSCGYYHNGPVTSCDCMASDAPKMVHLYTAPVPTDVLKGGES